MHSPQDVKDWTRAEVTKLFFRTIDEIAETATSGVRQAMLDKEFHDASRWLGCIEALERVKDIPNTLIEALVEEIGEYDN